MKRAPLAFGLAVLAAAVFVVPAAVSGLIPAAGVADPTTRAAHGPPGAGLHDSAAAAAVQATIAPWCADVPVTIHEGSGGEAGFTRSWHPLFTRNGEITEYLKVGLTWPADHPATRAVALHECAHILQYRAYDYDWADLENAMRQFFPDGPHSPVEHMADCMSEVMGAVRRGRSEDGQRYDAGYGGACNPEQHAAATRVVDGQRL